MIRLKGPLFNQYPSECVTAPLPHTGKAQELRMMRKFPLTETMNKGGRDGRTDGPWWVGWDNNGRTGQGRQNGQRWRCGRHSRDSALVYVDSPVRHPVKRCME